IQVLSNRNLIKEYLRGRILGYYQYSTQKTDYWDISRLGIFTVWSKRLTDLLFLGITYSHQQVKRVYDDNYWLYKDFSKTDIVTGEITFILDRNWQLETKLSFSPTNNEVVYKSIGTSFDNRKYVSSLILAEEMVDINSAKNRTSISFSNEVSYYDWQMKGTLNYYNMKRDESVRDFSIVTSENNGFQGVLSVKNYILDDKETSLYLFSKYTDFKRESRFYYSPRKLFHFGGGGVFYYQFNKRIEIKSSLDFAFNDKADIAWSTDALLTVTTGLFKVNLGVRRYCEEDLNEWEIFGFVSELRLF
ncbi:MAG: hypothetical protein PHR06_08450, partial [Candidatus Cloacimonetes bacterium]|nr:hypothetical protein [Candidatus Cloacimonadota bacterium]